MKRDNLNHVFVPAELVTGLLEFLKNPNVQSRLDVREKRLASEHARQLEACIKMKGKSNPGVLVKVDSELAVSVLKLIGLCLENREAFGSLVKFFGKFIN